VWAVGVSNTDAGLDGYRTLIEHFNGRSWSIVPAPNPESNGGDFLTGVAAITSSDAWAVGYYRNVNVVNGYPEQRIFPLVLHWDGASWQLFSGGSVFFSISAFSASDIWALGEDSAWHFNGTAWSPTPPFPPVNGFGADVFGLGGVSDDDLWAVGSYQPFEPETQTAALHWNGSTWSAVATPTSIDKTFHQLSSVVAVNADDVWAVGYAGSQNGEATHMLIEHWNGKSWSIVFSPNAAGTDELEGVAVSGPGTLWAVGVAGSDSSLYSTLILRTLNG
jgi:hypothetical protein